MYNQGSNYKIVVAMHMVITLLGPVPLREK